MNAHPIAREVLLAGGGHCHVIFLRMLAMQPIPGIKVTLISPEVETPYSGMLPGLIAGHYSRDQVYIDLVPLCRFAGADFVIGKVESVDPAAKTLTVNGRPPLRYDVLSLDVGSPPARGGLEAAGVIPVKPISSFLARWQAFLDRFEAGGIHDIGFVGAGAGGVELCLSVHFYLEQRYPDTAFRCHMLTEGNTVLRDLPASARITFEKLLKQKQIIVHRNFRAEATGPGQLAAADGRSLRFDEVFCVTQAIAQAWPGKAGMDVDEAGFIQVRDTLQSVSHPEIFAVGDCAMMVNHPRPKAGVYAVRAGSPLFENVRHLLLGEKLKPFKPQSRFLVLITTGPRHAVASRNGFSLSGNCVWRWKDWIDKRFMKRFSDLPKMEVESANTLVAEFGDQMHCGGCGSKVSADLLSDVVGEMLGEAMPLDDAAPVVVPPGRQLIQTVDHFRGFIGDPYLQARIAVCHAVSDIYACGGRVDGLMALLTLPFGKPDVTRSLLRQLMAGTIDQVNEEGGRLIGGHTAEGVELSVGFSVNGLIDPDAAWVKQGLQPGDCLILTKALGTGTIMAADMQSRAKGGWVNAAVDSMLLSNREAANVLHRFPVSACTDVTGFGLAGHLKEMLGISGMGIDIHVDTLPMLPGASACLDQFGISSTLHESNRRSSPVENAVQILFDPQTSGGLLVAVPSAEGEACVQALREACYHRTAIIGLVTEEPGLRVSEAESHG